MMFEEIMTRVTIIVLGIAVGMFVYYFQYFLKLVKERDGYYLARWLF